MKTILGIDPGIAGTGWAIIQTAPLLLVESGVLKGPSNDDWEQRGLIIAGKLKTIQHDYKLRECFIEYPSLFQSSHGQMVARKGDLVKLAWFTGVLSGKLRNANLVPVHEWKGQLPKKVVEKRIKKILGDSQCWKLKSHDWDATGIALYKANKL